MRNYFADYTKAELESESFLTTSKSVLGHILKLDSVSCSETDVFNACMACVKVKARQDQITEDIVCTHLGDFFDEIRFESMMAQEFAALALLYGDLFPADKYIKIMQTIMTSESFSASCS